jgi:GAF domain-containing protein
MKPVALDSNERLYFRLMLRGLGLDPTGFNFLKFAHRQGKRIRVRVFGRGSAAVYEVPDSGHWTTLFAQDLAAGQFGPAGVSLLGAEGQAVLRRFAAVLDEDGPTAALAILNQRVPHRFTAIYELKDNVFRNIALVDKECSVDTFSLLAVPLEDSFCQFVLRDGCFVTGDSGADDRLHGHPYCGVVRSYIGVPIPRQEGGLYGTLCHFDLAAHAVSDEEFLLLEHAAQLVSPQRLPAA